jgi:hypothetical protein
MRRRYAIFTISALLLCGVARGQTACGQSLIEAEGAYYAGRLDEVRRILNDCLYDGFTKDQKVEAYKLIALSWIFSRNYASADSALVSLLKLRPRFEPGAQDPPELQSRLDNIESRPLVGLHLLLGQYLPVFHVDEVYNLRGQPTDVTYSSSAGFVMGVASSYYLTKHWLIEASFETQEVEFEINNDDDLVETRMNEVQARSQWVAMAGYSHQWKGGIGIQALLGASYSTLRSATSSLYRLETVANSDDVIYREQLDFSNMAHRRRTEVRPMVLLRFLTPQKNLPYQLNVFFRYEWGLASSVKDRYGNIPQTIEYEWIEDDFRVSYFTLGLNITIHKYRVRL